MAERTPAPLALIFALSVGACSSDGSATPDQASTTGDPGVETCEADAECAASPETPLCDVATGACVPLPPGHEIGWKDGSPGTVALVPIYEPDKLRDPWDLEFNPSKPTELWVANHRDDSVIIIQNPGTPGVSWERKRDPAATHFMNNPPAIAFGDVLEAWGQTFGTCGDSDNGNDFIGPTLFSADPEVFAVATPDGLGSHLDMLHSTRFCRGIAHVEANVYFVFNSDKQSLDKYDFHVDHGPGQDDHSDGEIWRYVRGSMLGVEGVASHLVFDPSDAQLYAADTGNQRIVRLDTTSGTEGKTFSGDEPAKRVYVEDAALVEVVPPGTLSQPSGIELHGDLLYVTDHATSRFYVFDKAGQLIRHLDTGLPPGSLAGLTFSPEGKIHFVDVLTGRVLRIDPIP
jgi:hypothetical protein